MSKLDRRQRYFVTGTDTEVGKTVLSALLCAALSATYWKPIQTGAKGGIDRETVMRLAGIGEERTLPEVYCFDPPVSPHLAARWARTKTHLEAIGIPPLAEMQALIVEGAGGVYVPINERHFMLDLMAQLNLPVILAARSSLGTINHTLLSLAALRSAQLPVHGVVLIGEPNRDNREAIEQYGRVPVVGEIPRLAQLDRAALLRVFETYFDRSAFT